jgi:SNF2 family DNA or RNA helicase
MARCHRIGQDKEVTVYRLVTKVGLWGRTLVELVELQQSLELLHSRV